MAQNKTKIAVLTSHPIQYQAPVWKNLAQLEDIEVKVFFASDFSIRGYVDRGFNSNFKWDQPLTEGYPFETLGHGIKAGFFSLNGKGLSEALARFQPDCGLVCAYHPKFYIDGVRELKKLGAKVIMRAEVTDQDRKRGLLNFATKDLFLKWLYTKIDCFLAIGENARVHLLRLGVAENKIGFAGYNIDDDLFEKHYSSVSSSRHALKKSLGLSEDSFVFLSCGKFISKKNPLLLIEAFQKMPTEIQEKSAVVFLGEGELRPEMEALAGNDLNKKVILTGFVNQGELGKYYGAADCAVLPSQFGETWGLVVNEAQIFGLPCIVSDRVGCAPDLINKDTGRVFPSGNVEKLAEVMQEVIPWAKDNMDLIHNTTRAQVARYSSRAAAEAIRDAALSLQV